MNKYFLKSSALLVGLLISSVCSASTYLQVCGGGATAVSCSPSSSMNYTYSSLTMFQVFKNIGCSMTETKASLMDSRVGVDTYKCTSGDLLGYSFQAFYNKSTDNVTVIMMY
jgi:hypothetical protein